MKFSQTLALLAACSIASLAGAFQSTPAASTQPTQPPTPAKPADTEPPARKTRNVILCIVDGLRWQELFAGADETLFTEAAGGVKNDTAVREKFWRATPEERQ